MNQKSRKIRSFTDLNAWRKAHELVLLIYTATRSFPEDEKFGLVQQMRRCVVSIVSNIAEGFSRKSYKEKIQFYSMSLGSSTELQSQLLVSKDLDFIDKHTFEKIATLTAEVNKLLNGLIKKSKSIHDS
jgi:four helix bundle protein